MQEGFVVVHRQLPSFEGLSKMTTWLYGICVRVASTHRRRAWVRREHPTADLPETPSGEPGPDAALDVARERVCLQEVLDMMDIGKRSLLVMFELDQVPCEQIATLLDVPVGTVHSRLHAARADFREALARWNARANARPRKGAKPWWSFGRSE